MTPQEVEKNWEKLDWEDTKKNWQMEEMRRKIEPKEDEKNNPSMLSCILESPSRSLQSVYHDFIHFGAGVGGGV